MIHVHVEVVKNIKTVVEEKYNLVNKKWGVILNIELEKEMAKLPKLKEDIKEMGVSLWQGSFREKGKRVRTSNAGKWILG